MEPEQHEIYEYAHLRVRQKKRLYYHFVLLCIGSLFMYVANNWLDFYPETAWWMWVSTIWFFLFLLHAVKVFILDRFMSKQWERTQIDKLIAQQSQKIEQLKNDLENSKSTTT